jgi:hypothetical protein
MKKTLLLSLVLALFTFTGYSQSDKFWSSTIESRANIPTDKAVARISFPKEFKLFELNINSLRGELFSIVGNNIAKHSAIISLPNADGQIEQFEVFEASNFEPALQARFPEIRAYSGKGITDKSASLKLSISTKGIQTMVFRTAKENEFSEPYSQDHTIYAVYSSQRQKGKLAWSCSSDDKVFMSNLNTQIGITNRPESSLGELKTLRLAQSVTAEYSNFFGATSSAQVGLVIAAINNTLTRCNGVYEKDLALHLNLIANTTDVIYYNPATDPYSPASIGLSTVAGCTSGFGDCPGTWNNELQNTLTAIIGEANYDIGHLFGATGGGGNAGCIGCVCDALRTSNSTPTFQRGKGSGITSPNTGDLPQGDNFDIDFVVHEVGHQIGANHTFSFGLEGTGVNKEVGSGITIMGYAGITNQDVAPHSIDIFHEASIAQIQANLATKSCPVTTSISANNATPVVASVINRTIPISTPFVLTGSATDANAADVLTYCWEQNDNSTTSGNASVASPTKLTGPNWLSFSPTTNPARTFPRLSTVLAGLFVTPTLGGDAIANVEALSSVGRNLNFRLTVRDNSPYVSDPPSLRKVGQTAFTDMTVTVDATSGPFQVTVPNTAVSYPAGSTQTITWSVNNTTAPPVSCANVNILISTDGGNTFTALLSNTLNDGTEVVTMPTTPSTTARIKVESVGNIFFDISNTNFTIAVPPTDFNFGTITSAISACPAGATMTVNIPTTQTGGFANSITLAATAGVPVGTTVTFAANPVAPGATSVATLNNANILSAGTYTVTVTGTATGASVKTTTISFVITAGVGPVLTTNTVATTVCAPATATFTVATAAAPVTYQWQSAPTVGGTYTNISTATSASYTTAPTTAGMNGMGFRCIVSTQCGTTTSANALLTVNTAAAITTQPTNQTACTGATATFTAAASGTGVTYQWQSGTSATGPWTNVGTNTNTYVTAPLTITTPTFYQVVVSTTTCPATVTSNVVTLGVSVTTAINTQPTAQAVCAGATATYTTAAVGTGISYQWQMATAAAPTVFSNVGTNSNTYTTPATTAGMSGNIYHVVVTGSCNAITSSNVTLTVNTAAAITTQPTAVTLCNGVAATFTAAGSGTGVTYQWQSGPSATGPWASVTGGTGATTTTYTTAATIPAMNGTYYRMVATTTTCAAVVNSSAVLLTVNTVAVIGTQPTAQSACIPQTAIFNVAATGTGLTYQWQIALAATPTVFTDITGATNASYTTGAAALTMNGNLYRVSILSTCGAGVPTVSTAALLTVTNPVAITLQPTATSGCLGDNYTFTANAASPGNTITYQWQISNSGAPGSFVNIAGATNAPGGSPSPVSPSYNISSSNSLQNGTYYRVYFSVPCGTGISADTSAAGKLTLSLKPTIVLTAPATSSNNAAVNQSLITTISPANFVGTFNWTKNGAVIANTLASTSILLPVDGAGTYQVSTRDATTGCISTSNALPITVEQADNIAKGKLFVYPNPVSNTMFVRFNFPNVGTTGTILNIYDERGVRVMSVPYTLTGTSGRMSVNMSKVQLGTYLVYLMDASGKKLASTKVVKVQ